MKTKTVELTVIHHARCSAVEVQNLYRDYGHEWVSYRGIFISRKYDSAKYEILSPQEHHLTVTLVICGIFRLHFHQNVTILHGKRIVNEGNNIFGFRINSEWDLAETENGITEVKATYKIELPWILGFLEIPLRLFIAEIRRRSWTNDQVMLERRNELLRLGFGDGGNYPENRWILKAQPSSIPA